MKYYAEITLYNQPKNKAEEECQKLAIGYNKTLLLSQKVRDDLYKFLEVAVKHINIKHYRCGDVAIRTHKHGDSLTLTFAESTQLTFKAVSSELSTI